MFPVKDQVNSAQFGSKISRGFCTRRKNHSAQQLRVAGILIVRLKWEVFPVLCSLSLWPAQVCWAGEGGLQNCPLCLWSHSTSGLTGSTSCLCAWFSVLIKAFITEIGALRQGNCSSGCQILHYLFFNFWVMVEQKAGCSCLSSNRKLGFCLR